MSLGCDMIVKAGDRRQATPSTIPGNALGTFSASVSPMPPRSMQQPATRPGAPARDRAQLNFTGEQVTELQVKQGVYASRHDLMRQPAMKRARCDSNARPPV